METCVSSSASLPLSLSLSPFHSRIVLFLCYSCSVSLCLSVSASLSALSLNFSVSLAFRGQDSLSLVWPRPCIPPLLADESPCGSCFPGTIKSPPPGERVSEQLRPQDPNPPPSSPPSPSFPQDLPLLYLFSRPGIKRIILQLKTTFQSLIWSTPILQSDILVPKSL